MGRWMEKMKELNVNSYLNHNHSPFFRCTDREVLLYGGAGAGKSYSVTDKILINTVHQKVKLKVLVVRKTLPSLRRSCIPLFEQRANLFHIPYILNKSDFTGHLPNDTEINYLSMNTRDDYEKIKSITDVDIIWIEELNELTEPAYEELKRRLRGGKGSFSQMIGTLNPIGITSWVYQRFFANAKKYKNVQKFHTNVYDNPFIEDDYIRDLEELKESNLNLYNVYCLGKWGQLKGIIFGHCEVMENIPVEFEQVIYGLDFGFNKPTALLKIGERDVVFYEEELLYKTGLTNSELIKEMDDLNVDRKAEIYCDSSEPDRIKELVQSGYNAKPADKSVMDGINLVKDQTIYMDSNSSNLIKENDSYVWKENKDGLSLDEPVKFMDHLMDARRYALYTHYGKRLKPPVPQKVKGIKKKVGRSKVRNLPT